MSLYETDHPRIVLVCPSDEESEKMCLALEGVGQIVVCRDVDLPHRALRQLAREAEALCSEGSFRG